MELPVAHTVSGDQSSAGRGAFALAVASWVIGFGVFGLSILADHLSFPDGGHMGERYAFDQLWGMVFLLVAGVTFFLNVLAICVGFQARSEARSASSGLGLAGAAMVMGAVGLGGSFFLAIMWFATGMAYV